MAIQAYDSNNKTTQKMIKENGFPRSSGEITVRRYSK